MGALCMLLLVTTHKTRRDAVARAEAEMLSELIEQQERQRPKLLPEPETEPAPIAPEPLPVPVVDLNAALRQKVAELVKKRDARRKLTADDQAALSAAQAALEESAQVVSQSQQQIEKTRAAISVQAEEQLKFAQERSELSGKILEAEQQLRRHREKVTQAATHYAFVPYDGSSGTIRRPILIECSSQGFRFLQENILLTADDVDGFTPSFNPLLSGARALIEYWGRRAKEPNEPEPYVLLIVRPSGSTAYYAARKLLGRLSQPWGYELLSESEKLDLPAEDLKATEACRDAIEQARRQRGNRLHPARNGSGGGGPGDRAVRFRRGNDGFEVVESDELPRLAAGGDVGSGGARSERPGVVSSARSGSRPGLSDPSSVFGSAPPATGGWTRSGDRKAGHRSSAATPGESTESAAETKASRLGNSGNSLQQGGDGASSADQDNQTRQHGENAARPKIATANSDHPEVRTEVAPSERTPAAPDAGGNPPRPLSDPPRTRAAFDIERDFGSPDNSDPRKRWGLINRRATIGFEKKIVIEVTEREVLIGDEPPLPVGNGETAEQLARALRQGIEIEAREWGYPPQNFYWVPSLKFIVHPGGHSHYERMKDAAAAWELTTSVQFARSSAGPAGGGD